MSEIPTLKILVFRQRSHNLAASLDRHKNVKIYVLDKWSRLGTKCLKTGRLETRRDPVSKYRTSFGVGTLTVHQLYLQARKVRRSTENQVYFNIFLESCLSPIHWLRIF